MTVTTRRLEVRPWLAAALLLDVAYSYTIAVVGRPNVGKSTIFNRVTRKFGGGALVFDEPGVTRDRTYGQGFWGAHEFTVVDTGGLVFDDDPDEVFLPQIRQQALAALGEADVAVMVVDGKEGCTVLDSDIAAFLRKQDVPVVLAVNKCESHVQGDLQAADFWGLGLGDPIPVSGIHGTGMGDLMDEVIKPFGAANELEEGEKPLAIAILGKPNVGKSSLLNRLTGVDRAIVSSVAGTTRDVIDQTLRREGKEYVFLDTAGVRRGSKVGRGVEELMVRRALKEARLSTFANEAGRACVVVVNKWDLVANKDDRLYRTSRSYVESKLTDVSWAQCIYVSAKTGLKTQELFKAIDAAAEQHQRRVGTSVMNEVLEDAVRWQKPPSTSTGKRGNIYYCAQVSVKPPTIAIFCNDPELFSANYRKFLETQMRKSLGFAGTPIRLLFRARRVARDALNKD